MSNPSVSRGDVHYRRQNERRLLYKEFNNAKQYNMWTTVYLGKGTSGSVFACFFVLAFSMCDGHSPDMTLPGSTMPSCAATDGSGGVVDEAPLASDINDGRMAPKSVEHTAASDETILSPEEHRVGELS